MATERVDLKAVRWDRLHGYEGPAGRVVPYRGTIWYETREGGPDTPWNLARPVGCSLCPEIQHADWPVGDVTYQVRAWKNGQLSANPTRLTRTYSQPQGHAGATTRDEGTVSGGWPGDKTATAVGGTSLYLAGASGTYETAEIDLGSEGEWRISILPHVRYTNHADTWEEAPFWTDAETWEDEFGNPDQEDWAEDTWLGDEDHDWSGDPRQAPATALVEFTVYTDAGDPGDYVEHRPGTYYGRYMQIRVTMARTVATADLAVTGATNATPIVITTAAHGLETGATVTVYGVAGNTAANGDWFITKVSDTQFSLDHSVGNGAYTSGGTVVRGEVVALDTLYSAWSKQPDAVGAQELNELTDVTIGGYAAGKPLVGNGAAAYVDGTVGLGYGGTNANLTSVGASRLVRMNAGQTAIEDAGVTVSDLATDADLATHAALTTGVHGAGASTLATTANIATHAALDTGVHGVGASTVASAADIATAVANYLPLAGGDITGNLSVAGNLGVGTVAPAYDLEVDGNVGITGTLNLESGSGSYDSYLQATDRLYLANTRAGVNGEIYIYSQYDDVRLKTAGGDLLLTAAGHVDLTGTLTVDTINEHSAGVGVTVDTVLIKDGSVDGVDVSAHAADGTIHFTEASIDHTAIANIGTTSHAGIDTHIGASTGVHGVGASTVASVANIATHAAVSVNVHGLGAGVSVAGVSGAPATGNLAAFDASDVLVDSGYAAASFAGASHSHAAADVTSGEFANARIAESNVTQHVAAIDHDSLLNFAAGEHFTEASIDHTAISNIGTTSHAGIDTHIGASTDVHGVGVGVSVAGTSGATTLDNFASFNASGVLVDSGYAEGSFAAASHTHDDRYYTETELLTTGVLDTRYYTESEVDTFLAGKADTSHVHDAGDIASGQLGLARGGTAADLSAGGVNSQFVRFNATSVALEASGYTSASFAPASHNHAAGDITSGVLGVARGGTNAGSFTVSQLVRMNAGGTALESSGKVVGDFAEASHNHAAGDVTSGTFANARISQASVTQHVAAIDHDALLNFAAGEHRTINDVGSGVTDLWSADKIGTELAGKASSSHTHDDRYYTETELLTTGVLDARYYTEGEVDTELAGKADVSHTHAADDIVSGQLGLARGGAGADLSGGGVGNQFVRFNAGSAALEASGFTGASFASASHNHAAGDITSGVLPIARGGTNNASYSDVEFLMFNSALNQFQSSGYEPASFAAAAHDHDGRYFTETELTNGQLDSRYYTETEINTFLAGKADVSHTHAASAIVSGQVGLARGGTNADLSAGGVNLQFLRFNATSAALEASGFTSASFAGASHAHPASDITSGTLGIARGGTNVGSFTASQLVRMNAGGTALESSGKVVGDFADVVHTHAATDVTSGTFVNARISQTSVTQHVAAIDHDGLLNYAVEHHRAINDAGSGVTDLWSASKITTELAGKANTSHSHAAGDVTSGTFANARIAESSVTQHEAAIDHDALTNFSIGEHRTINDAGVGVTDLWSADKITTELAGKSGTAHTHDGRYYTESEVDTALALKLNLAGGTMGGNINMGGYDVQAVGNIYTDTMDERNVGAGVTIDGCRIKDGKVYIGTAGRAVITDASGYAIISPSVLSGSSNTQFWHDTYHKYGEFVLQVKSGQYSATNNGCLSIEDDTGGSGSVFLSVKVGGTMYRVELL